MQSPNKRPRSPDKTSATPDKRSRSPEKTSQDKHKKQRQEEISAEEAKLYDRQIRLWGMQAQNRMRNAKILMIHCTGLSNEVLKNIVLAGCGHVTIVDPEMVTKRDLGSQFLISEKDLGSNRAEALLERLQILNPRVHLEALKKSAKDLDEQFIKQFDLVTLVRGAPDQIKRINNICRTNKIGFWAADVIGISGYIFCDLGHYQYTQETKKDDQTIQEELKIEYDSFASFLTKKRGGKSLSGPQLRKFKRRSHPLYFGLRCFWVHWLKHGKKPEYDTKFQQLVRSELEAADCDPSFVPEQLLQDLVKNYGKELNPPCAVLGGFLAQELLKVLSRKESPFDNFFILDLWNVTGMTMKI